MKLSTAFLLLSSCLVSKEGIAIDVAGGQNRNEPRGSGGGSEPRGSGGGAATFNLPEPNSNDKNKKSYSVLVKAENQKGVKLASAMSVGAKSLSTKKSDIVALEVSYEQMMELQNDKNIKRVEENSPMYVLEDYVSAVRDLQQTEEVPYGIEQALQDLNFWKNVGEPPEGSSVKVCVADTGYAYGHPDLPVEPNVHGDNYVPVNGNWNNDGHGHGTHCSGTVAAVGENAEGVIGVIPGNFNGKFTLEIAKALSDEGEGTTAGVLEAVKGCVESGSNVVSLSLGGGGYSQTSDEIYEEYYEDGVLFVAAAGNGASSAYSYPASYKSLMSVAANDSNENKASFSQYNDQVEISAAGVDVLSTLPGPPGPYYKAWSGTSMATPHVAGVAGLLWLYFPQCKNYQIRDAMLRTAKDINSDTDPGCDNKFGHGMVQAMDAYLLLESGFCDTDSGYVAPVGGCNQLTCSVDSECDDGDECTIDVCSDSQCIHEFSCVTCGQPDAAETLVKVTTDTYYIDTSWKVADGDGSIVISKDSYPSKNSFEDNYCLPEGSYTFTILDSYGDGICCSYGDGSYEVLVKGDSVASGGEFTDEESTSFEVTAPTTSAPVIAPTISAPVTAPTTSAPVIAPTISAPVTVPTSPSPPTGGSTPFPTGKAPTPYPTHSPPTPYPTEVPPTPHPTHTPPTPYPFSSPVSAPTPHPTEKAPTPHPTDRAPTPWPTHTPPTPHPTGTPPTMEA